MKLKIKYNLLILIIILIPSCKNEYSKTDLNLNCVEETKTINNSSNLIYIKTCEFKNHLFKSIATVDNKDRYSYNYELFRVKKSDTLKISNSDFFENNIELEQLINKKLKSKYNSNLKVPELSDCMKWIKFRHYNLNEFGISFTENNEMIFNIDYNIGSACFNVSSNSVIINFSELEHYLN